MSMASLHRNRIGCLLLFSGCVACRSDLKVKVKAQNVVTLNQEILINRSYFQSRNPINFTLNSELFQPAGVKSLAVKNQTTQHPLIQDAPIERLALGLTQSPIDGESFTLAPTSRGFSISVSIYPLDESDYGGFVFGDNTLNIQVKSAKTLQQEDKHVYLKDFDLAATATTGFPENIQVKEGFQGWLTPIGNLGLIPANQGGSLITSGFGSIIND